MRVGDAHDADWGEVGRRVEGVSSQEKEETVEVCHNKAEEGKGDGNDVEGEGLQV